MTLDWRKSQDGVCQTVVADVYLGQYRMKTVISHVYLQFSVSRGAPWRYLDGRIDLYGYTSLLRVGDYLAYTLYSFYGVHTPCLKVMASLNKFADTLVPVMQTFLEDGSWNYGRFNVYVRPLLPLVLTEVKE